MDNVNYKKVIYAPILIVLLTVTFFGQVNGEFFGIKQAFGYGGGGLWRYGEGLLGDLKNVNSVNMPLIIGYEQEGETYYNLSDGKVLTLKISRGTVPLRSAFMIYEGVNNAPPKDASAQLVGGKVIRIGAVDENGALVKNFLKPVDMRVTFPKMLNDKPSVSIYYFDKPNLKWVKISNATINTKTEEIAFTSDRTTSFAVFSIPSNPNELPANFYEGQGEVLGVAKFSFRNNLAIGSKGNDVLELQKRLVTEKDYCGFVGGDFGALTKKAVINYQSRNGLPATGFVGPLTRAKLNASAVLGVSIAKNQTSQADTQEETVRKQAYLILLQNRLKKLLQK